MILEPAVAADLLQRFQEQTGRLEALATDIDLADCFRALPAYDRAIVQEKIGRLRELAEELMQIADDHVP